LNDVAEALDRLRSRFLARAADDLDNLRRWTTDPPADAEDLHRLVHRLSGAAGTFGFRRLSDLAATAEDALVTGGPNRTGALADLVEELERLTGPGASD
jgi:HPt (histidine-containing phosphotransfer) domain-containing protein